MRRADGQLPEIVAAYLRRAIPAERPCPAAVTILQRGEMWLRPGAAARRFTAVQRIATGEVGFAWRATFGLVPLVSLRVVDRFAAGEGSLEGRVLGVRVMRQSGHETSLGEALRYLAELPWTPFAMSANPQLEWRQLDDETVEVTTRVQGARAAVKLLFDAAGDIRGARAEDRPFRQGKRWAPMPWSGGFGEYAVLDGVRVPTRAEVRWELPEGPYTYWRGEVTALSCDAPRARSEDHLRPLGH
jgi:hypothetical protein